MLPNTSCQKVFLFTAALFVLATTLCAQDSPSLKPADLKNLEGNWTGTLTYLDYTTNKSTTLKIEIAVQHPAPEARKWALSYVYPDEPKANSQDEWKLSSSGTALNDAPIAERVFIHDGSLKLVTERNGKDNNRSARIRTIYLIGPEKMSIQKQVRYADAEEWLVRNTYQLTRVAALGQQ